MPAPEYSALKRQMVLDALARESLRELVLADTIEIPPGTRRRATLKARREAEGVELGFHAKRSHTIIDMHECRILTPALVRLLPGLRAMLASRLKRGEKADVYVVEADNGIDLALAGIGTDVATTAWAARWADTLKLSRITSGQETVVESAPPFVTFGRATVPLPPVAFLQPTREGERRLQELLADAAKGARRIADLFCGLGTFALVLAESAPVNASDLDVASVAALQAAVRATPRLKPVSATQRDLYRRPLTGPELAGFDLVVLDPPRAGAERQCRELTVSGVGRIIYVSCNPTSFARDARLLVAGGYRPGTITPVDQFLWSSHSELVASFSRA